MGNAPAEYPPNRYMLDWDGNHPSRTYKVVDVNTGETVFTSPDSLKAMAESYRRNAEVGFSTGRPKSTQAKTDAA